jgi:hypothetical protein
LTDTDRDESGGDELSPEEREQKAQEGRLQQTEQEENQEAE